MRHQELDLLGFTARMTADAICIPTNGVVSYQGFAVMGAGLAKKATRQWPTMAYQLGLLLKDRGNHVHPVIEKTEGFWEMSHRTNNKFTVCSFPTKHHYKNASTLELVEQSAQELFELANERNWTGNIYLPRVGCGLGRLSWDKVEPLLQRFLDDRFVCLSL